VGAIVPWNFPASLIAFKLPPLLPAGCAVVIKPSSETALDGIRLAPLSRPGSGEVNIVAAGREVDAYLVEQPSVDKIALTGSTAAGRKIAERRCCGWFVTPTVFADVENRATIAMEKIFGPVLSVIPFDGDDKAVQIAKYTEYGLGGSVWTSDLERGEAVAPTDPDRLNRDQPLHADPAAPFGGVKQRALARNSGPRACNRSLLAPQSSSSRVAHEAPLPSQPVQSRSDLLSWHWSSHCCSLPSSSTGGTARMPDLCPIC
jgi:acyl-CoA reductase-like NAD-dependent aldehyde dehydrogenase